MINFFALNGWMMLVSRVMIGLYTGSHSALIRTYVARVLLPEERMGIVGILSSLGGLFYAVSPGINNFLLCTLNVMIEISSRFWFASGSYSY